MVTAKRNGLESEQSLKDLTDKTVTKYYADLSAAKHQVFEYAERILRMSVSFFDVKITE